MGVREKNAWGMLVAGTAVYLGLALSGILEGVATVVAYRTGVPW